MAAIEAATNYEVEGPQAMMRMSCATAAALLGCLALYGCVNLLATADDVAVEFSLTPRMCDMLAAQLGFRWMTEADRDPVAGAIVGAVLCLFQTYNASAELVADVSRILVRGRFEGLEMVEAIAHALAVISAIEAGIAARGRIKTAYDATGAGLRQKYRDTLYAGETFRGVPMEEVWRVVVGGGPVAKFVEAVVVNTAPNFRLMHSIVP